MNRGDFVLEEVEKFEKTVSKYLGEICSKCKQLY